MQGEMIAMGTDTLCPFLCFSEEAVNEVKRQAMSELQKAVSDAERKAHEMISAERSKMERALAEAKRQASEDALTVINQQEDSSEVSITEPLLTHIFVLNLIPLDQKKCVIVDYVRFARTKNSFSFFFMLHSAFPGCLHDVA